ncbi:hypothetical protein CYK21_10685 [Streptococcus macedonicus]|uniref:Uncharacterized protein n=2 Tax=Streptococcus TaxID=1301 RepID=E0PBN5_STREI|nr:hypothetical protein HMPREF9319_0258 [Streptococcus equinus ATCC 700338]KUE92783.1 hypothetical protein AU078_07625 [Streptococcus gallolyticus]KXI14548.1 hypothetical protein HMPREF3205_00248 [Streptococcus pasteurianus]PLA53158.1 hypothetical protein CYK21_10685 [Streptococcus macedonicus]RGB44416.1 hypothetical protein DW662_10690 [Streptococcus gallolyticus]
MLLAIRRFVNSPASAIILLKHADRFLKMKMGFWYQLDFKNTIMENKLIFCVNLKIVACFELII